MVAIWLVSRIFGELGQCGVRRVNHAVDGHETAVGRVPVRGPLRIEVNTSSPTVEAGRPFSILVTIHNPYDVPIVISAVTSIVPVEFVDIERRKFDKDRAALTRRSREISQEIYEGISPSRISTSAGRLLDVASSVLGASFPMMSLIGDVASQVIVASIADSPAPRMSLKVEHKPHRPAQDRESESSARLARRREALREQQTELREIMRAAEQARFSSVTLNPGNSIVQLFTIRTGRTIFFAPSTYEIPMQVRYTVDGSEHQDTTRYKLSVRVPLSAVIAGSVLGSIAGFLLKSLLGGDQAVALLSGKRGAVPIFVVSMIGDVILGAIAVVALVRKRDAQPFITVEDFWGGLFVGALSGYAGKSVLHGLFANG